MHKKVQLTRRTQKELQGWILLTRLTDRNCGFWKLDSISDFQSSFLLFVTFHIILGIKICLTRSGDLVINNLFRKYWLKLNILSPRRDHTRTGNQRSAIVILIPLRMLTTTLSSKQFGHFCLKDKFNEHRRSVDKTNIKSKPTILFLNTFPLTLTILTLTCS